MSDQIRFQKDPFANREMRPAQVQAYRKALVRQIRAAQRTVDTELEKWERQLAATLRRKSLLEPHVMGAQASAYNRVVRAMKIAERRIVDAIIAVTGD